MKAETTPEIASEDDPHAAPSPASTDDVSALPEDVGNRGERDIEEEETADDD